MIALSDVEKPHLPLNPLLKIKLEKLIKGTDIEEMLKEFNII